MTSVANPRRAPRRTARPGAVLTTSSAADVRAAVLAAAEAGLPVTVEATGHGTHWTAEGAVKLDTSGMATVLVDPDRRVARAGAGARWGAVLAAAAPFGLAPLCGSSPDVGVTGYTLGGGVGWLARRYGFAADSLLRAEVVTADGALVAASADEHPDLFWALRGGGGSFGVVTALEFRLHPVERVYAGVAHFPIEGAAETLARYGEWAAGAPDELSTALLLTRREDGTRTLALKAMYAGDAVEAERALRPLRDVAGTALSDGMRTARFADVAMGGTPPKHLDLVRELPDGLIDALLRAAEHREVTAVEVRHWGGAMARPAADAGPVGHRDVPFSVIVDAVVPEIAAALAPYATGGKFLNFLADTRRTAAAHTPANHARLREVKRAYDPANVFRVGHTIAPAR